MSFRTRDGRAITNFPLFLYSVMNYTDQPSTPPQDLWGVLWAFGTGTFGTGSLGCLLKLPFIRHLWVRPIPWMFYQIGIWGVSRPRVAAFSPFPAWMVHWVFWYFSSAFSSSLCCMIVLPIYSTVI